MSLRVIDIAHAALKDIDTDARFDAVELDATVFKCLRAASDALMRRPPARYPAFEASFLSNIVDGLRSSHISIRKLLAGGHDPSSVDALVIARLQLESLYNFCFLIEDAEHLRLYLKNGWKKQYIRFLLGREESKNLPRSSEFYRSVGPEGLEKLRIRSFVTEAERTWLEFEELGAVGLAPPKTEIAPFPTPGKVLKRLSSGNLAMLKRLYPEYQHLCSFAHGAHEATVFRTLTDDRSPIRSFIEPWKAFDIGQRQVAEPAVLMSSICSVCVATEVFAAYPEDVELAAKLSEAWKVLTSISLLAGPVYALRAKQVMGVL